MLRRMGEGEASESEEEQENESAKLRYSKSRNVGEKTNCTRNGRHSMAGSP